MCVAGVSAAGDPWTRRNAVVFSKEQADDCPVDQALTRGRLVDQALTRGRLRTVRWIRLWKGVLCSECFQHKRKHEGMAADEYCLTIVTKCFRFFRL